MSRLESVYVVRDPQPSSVLGDILFCIATEAIGRYVIGAGPGVWEDEHTTLYTTEAEANVDARARMAARDTPAEDAADNAVVLERHDEPETPWEVVRVRLGLVPR